jgi:hypothetical protein
MTTERLGTWTIIGILVAMLLGVLHAVAEAQLARTTRLARRFPAGWFES